MILHPQLKKDCVIVGKLTLCAVLLMPDANYPGLILVPQRENIREIYELSREDQQQLSVESSFVAQTMAEAFDADKINIAALGNMVPQLHIHHIARYTYDAAWPNPVWGFTAATPYPEGKLQLVVEHFREILHITS